MIVWSQFVIAGLLFLLAPEYELVRHDEEVVSGLIPGTTVVEETAHWSNSQSDLYVSYWRPSPPRDGGPMKAEESWKVVVLGHEVEVSETSMFFGREQRVLVAHVRLKEPPAVLMIHSPNMSREEFVGILERIQRAD